MKIIITILAFMILFDVMVIANTSVDVFGDPTLKKYLNLGAEITVLAAMVWFFMDIASRF